MPKNKLQSAMEYLMTYGWAILVIAVVLGALYQLGVFSSNPLSASSSCLATAGFLCQTPTLNASGSLAIKFGQIGLGTITVTNVACTTNVTSPTSTQTANAVLTSGQTSILTFSCPLPSTAIGTSFKGYIWITYNTQTQTGIVDRIAVVTSKVSTQGSSASALGGTGGNGVITPYIYCIGSDATSPNNQVYTASLSSSGVGAWTSSNSYPVAMTEAGCSIYNKYIYCVGTNSGTSMYAYYASVSSSGLGPWTSTTNYPISLYYAGCSAYNGYIYCIGTSGASPFTQTYYAPLSSAGIGTWTSTTSYPVTMYGAGCSINNGYIYCVGTVGAAPQTQAYYAPVSSSGIGAWTSTTSYPIPLLYGGCSINNGYIYCVGSNYGSLNLVYYAAVSSSGIGSWTYTTAYPIGMYGAGCSINNGYIYCVGSGSSFLGTQVYYAPVSSTGVGSWVSTTSYPIKMSGGSCQISGSGGGLFGGGGPN